MTTASNGNGSGARGGQFPQREHGRTNGLAPNPPEKGRTVLITGGAGYIGTVLTGRLLERGYNVRLLDRLYWGEGPLEAYAGRIDVEVADVRDIPGSALDGVDGVIHLAGLSNDPTAEYDPDANWQMNAVATEALGNACVERGIERIVFASSCSLYDGLPAGMHDESAADSPARRLRHLQALRRGGAARADRQGPLPGDPAQRDRVRVQPAHALRPGGQHLRQGCPSPGAPAAARGRLDVAAARRREGRLRRDDRCLRGAGRRGAAARSSTSCTRTTRSASWRCWWPARSSCSGARSASRRHPRRGSTATTSAPTRS